MECWANEEEDSGDPPRLWAPNAMLPGTAFTRSIGDACAFPPPLRSVSMRTMRPAIVASVRNHVSFSLTFVSLRQVRGQTVALASSKL